jgi:hypothetical protein
VPPQTAKLSEQRKDAVNASQGQPKGEWNDPPKKQQGKGAT